MKKLFCVCCFACVFLSMSIPCLCDMLKLTVQPEMYIEYNNSVGDEWSGYFEVVYMGNVIPVEEGEKISLNYATGTEIELRSFVQENDDYPDKASGTIKVTLTENELSSLLGTEREQKLTVTEDRGRYEGNHAIVKVVFNFHSSNTLKGDNGATKRLTIFWVSCIVLVSAAVRFALWLSKKAQSDED